VASLPVSFWRSLWYTYFAPGARALTPDQQDGVGGKTCCCCRRTCFFKLYADKLEKRRFTQNVQPQKIADYFGITVEELMGTKKEPAGMGELDKQMQEIVALLNSATRWKRCCAPGQSRSESADKRQICFGRGFGQDGQSLGDHKLKSRGKRQIK
jgi:hypothetical protein